MSNFKDNKNASMHPIPTRDNYYNNSPSPAMFFEQSKDKCLFNNNKIHPISNNELDFDGNLNSLQQSFLKQTEFKLEELIDNNLNSKIKSDIHQSTKLLVDSMDRDFDKYQNSFNFRLQFNPTSNSVQPYIYKKLENVKEIKIRKAVLPDYYNLEKVEVDTATSTLDDTMINILDSTLLEPDTDTEYTDGGNTIVIIWYEQDGDNLSIDFFDTADSDTYEKVYSAIIDTSGGVGALVIDDFNYYTYKTSNPTRIRNDRFVQLYISELDDQSNYTTDINRSRAFGILYPSDIDGIINDYNDMNCNETELIFKKSNLGTINSMTFQLLDSLGNELSTTANKNFDVDNTSKDNIYTSSGDVSYVSPSLYIRHPLYIKSQCHFIFEIITYHPDINNNLFS